MSRKLVVALAGVLLGCSEPSTLADCRLLADAMNPELLHVAKEYGDGSRVSAEGWRSLGLRYDRLAQSVKQTRVKATSLVGSRENLRENFAAVSSLLLRIAQAKDKGDEKAAERFIKELSPLARRHATLIVGLNRICQVR